MIKIQINGVPFKVPTKREEIPYDRWLQLEQTGPEDFRKRLTITMGLPPEPYLKVGTEHTLALYELVAFIEDVPELVPNSYQPPTNPVAWVSSWPFNRFEAIRQSAQRHQGEIGLVAAFAVEVLQLPAKTWQSAGFKALDAMHEFLKQWEGTELFKQEATDIEESAGIDRLQSFGVYPMLESIAAKFGKLPEEIEEKPTGFIFKEWLYQIEKNRFEKEYNEIQTKTTRS